MKSRVGTLWVVSIALLAGCADPPPEVANGSSLVYPGDGGQIEATMPGVRQHEAHTYGAIMLCTSTEDSVTLEHAVAKGGNGGLRITRFSTRTRPKADQSIRSGYTKGPLETLGFSVREPVTVATPCQDSDQSLTELAVQFERVSVDTGTSMSIQLTYSNGSTTSELSVPFGVTLCAIVDRTTPHCTPR